MQKVERKQITLSCEQDEKPVPVEVIGYVCDGLAIHRSIGRKGHTLTHIRSSMSIRSGLRSPKTDDIQTLQEIESLMDWSLSFDAIASIWVHDKTVKEAVFSRLKKLHS